MLATAVVAIWEALIPFLGVIIGAMLALLATEFHRRNGDRRRSLALLLEFYSEVQQNSELSRTMLKFEEVPPRPLCQEAGHQLGRQAVSMGLPMALTQLVWGYNATLSLINSTLADSLSIQKTLPLKPEQRKANVESSRRVLELTGKEDAAILAALHREIVKRDGGLAGSLLPASSSGA